MSAAPWLGDERLSWLAETECYRIEPTATGCRVTEWSEDLRPESVLALSKEMSGVDDRGARNRQTMSGTLDRLAAALSRPR